MAGAEPA